METADLTNWYNRLSRRWSKFAEGVMSFPAAPGCQFCYWLRPYSNNVTLHSRSACFVSFLVYSYRYVSYIYYCYHTVNEYRPSLKYTIIIVELITA